MSDNGKYYDIYDDNDTASWAVDEIVAEVRKDVAKAIRGVRHHQLVGLSWREIRDLCARIAEGGTDG